MSERKTCECGMKIVSRTTFGFLDTLDIRRETEKHNNLLELKTRDPESWKLSLDKKTEQTKCPCGVLVCRWTMLRHQQTPSHVKRMSKKKQQNV